MIVTTILLNKRAFDPNFLPFLKYVTRSFPVNGKNLDEISVSYAESLYGISACTTAGKLLACQSGSAVFAQLLIA